MSTVTKESSTAATGDAPEASPATPDLPFAARPAILTAEDIYKLLPHRYPFALVDRIVEYVPGQRAVGLKNVTYNEPFFQGHFPGRPLMPGVLIVEAMAQVGGVIMSHMDDNSDKDDNPDKLAGLFVFAGIDGCRFRRPVVPGDQLVMTLETLNMRRRFGKMRGQAEVNGQLVAEGELMFSLINQ